MAEGWWVCTCIVTLFKRLSDEHERINSNSFSLLSAVGKNYGLMLIEKIRN